MQRIAAAPLGSFLVAKKLPENAFYRSDAAMAKRRLQTVVFATRLQLSLGVLTAPTQVLSSVCFQQSLVGYL